MHAYLNPTGKYNNAVLDSIAEVGLAVLLGGISTFLAVFPLAFCQSPIFVVFFKTFFGTIVTGLLYSLILLPILLSFIGPKPHQINNQVGAMSSLDDNPKNKDGEDDEKVEVTSDEKGTTSQNERNVDSTNEQNDNSHNEQSEKNEDSQSEKEDNTNTEKEESY